MSAFSLRMRARVFARLLLLQSTWSFERMQGIGFAFALEPWLERLYPRPEDFNSALGRHFEYFNTQPYAASLVAGVVCGLEEGAAAAAPEGRAAIYERISAVKKAMASALAGLGDSFFWCALRPMSAACALLAGFLIGRQHPRLAGLAGAAVYLTVYNTPSLWLRWRGLALGYQWREQTPARLKELRVQRWISGARWAGLAASVVLLALILGERGDQRLLGLAAIAVFLILYRLFPSRATAMRLYAAVCLIGILSSAAGWP